MAGEDVDYSPRNRSPDVFTMNGKSLPRTLHPEEGSPIIVDHGDRPPPMVNAGCMSHPMHTHNHRFRLVEKTAGRSPSAQYEQDVTNIAPAERHTIEFEANADPGIYLMHCHKVNHAMNGNPTPAEWSTASSSTATRWIPISSRTSWSTRATRISDIQNEYDRRCN